MRLIVSQVFIILVIAANSVCAAPVVSSIELSAEKTPLYDIVEADFEVETVARNVYRPYVEDTGNPGVASKVGVSVDGLFYHENSDEPVVQPAFWFQDYERKDYLWKERHRDWLYPKGKPHWKLRFAPAKTGKWTLRIRVRDKTGETISGPYHFECVNSDNRGFVEVSPHDFRYFRTSDGEYLNLIGIADATTETYGVDEYWTVLAENGVNLLRPWWNASQGPVLFGMSGQGGVRDWRSPYISSEVSYEDQLFCGRLFVSGDKKITETSTYTSVRPSTKYRFSAMIKTVGAQWSTNGGLFLSVFDALNASSAHSSRIKEANTWTEVDLLFVTKPNQYIVDFLKIVAEGLEAGTVYYTNVSLRQYHGEGDYGPELISLSDFNPHMHYSQKDSFKADYQCHVAKDLGIYLKIVLQEKQDIVFGAIQEDGSAGNQGHDNVYAWDGHASRILQKYFWRYIIARYSPFTSVHSYEFVNEGDPYNGRHVSATEVMSQFFAKNDPYNHLCSTSNWHSYPVYTFWQHIPSCGYTDWHRYVYVGPNEKNVVHAGWQIEKVRLEPGDSISFDKNVFKSAKSGLRIKSEKGRDVYVRSYPIAVVPGHEYEISFYIKGENVSGKKTTGSEAWAAPWLICSLHKDWRGNEEVASFYEVQKDLVGTYDWKKISYIVPAEKTNGAHFMTLAPSNHWASGTVWFDDVTVRDVTTGKRVDVVNSRFNDIALGEDTALLIYSVGATVGDNKTRAIEKPFIRGEIGVSGDNIYGSEYMGRYYSGENQDLAKDEKGIWFKKLVWGHINHFGVTDMYWWTENIRDFKLWKYAKAYQVFMADVDLAAGGYEDLQAVASDGMRVWGQKNLKTGRAHLWIDNKDYNWKNYVAENLPGPLSGQVEIPGFLPGKYTIEFWDTTTGRVIQAIALETPDEIISLEINGLVSDIAVKIYPYAAKKPSESGKNGTSATVAQQGDNKEKELQEKRETQGQYGDGNTIKIMVELKNISGRVISEKKYIEKLPALTEFVSVDYSQCDWDYDSYEKEIVCRLVDLAPGKTVKLTYTVRVNYNN